MTRWRLRNSRSRGHQHLLETLGEFQGTVLSDGHRCVSALRRERARHRAVHAQCWTHTRREFVKAENTEPDAVAEALELIGVLYRVETHIRKKGYDDKDALACRAEQAKPAG